MSTSFDIKDRILLFLLCLLLFSLRLTDLVPDFLSWDVFGYYLYLPAYFIYNDLAISDLQWLDQLNEQYEFSAHYYQLTLSNSSTHIIKYSMGMAILFAPFFFIAHIIALLFGFPADGLSAPYQYSLLAEGILIAFLGLIYLLKILKTLFPDKVARLATLLIVLGTNYFHLTIDDGTLLTHNFLFTLYALLVYHTLRYYQEPKLRSAFIIGCCIGLITIIRPSEAICMLIPLLWSPQKLFDTAFLKNHWKHLLLVAVLSIALFIPQLLYWKMLSGDFFFYSYNNAGEGLDFKSPHILSFLFSFKKGWILYTPLSLFFIWGMKELYKSHRTVFYSVLVFILIDIYVIASWTNWWYAGGSFSSRSIVPAYVILAIPLAALLNSFNRKSVQAKLLLASPIAFVLLLNLFQSWQFREGILSKERMTMAYYFSIFGKMHADESSQKLLSINKDIDQLKGIDQNEHHSITLYHSEFNAEISHPFIEDDKMMLSPKNPYSPGIKLKYENLSDGAYAIIQSKARIFIDSSKDETANVYLVSTFLHQGKAYHYSAKQLSTENYHWGWNEFSMNYITPHMRSTTDEFQAYIWYNGQQEIAIDYYSLEAFLPKKKKSFFDDFKSYN